MEEAALAKVKALFSQGSKKAVVFPSREETLFDRRRPRRELREERLQRKPNEKLERHTREPLSRADLSKGAFLSSLLTEKRCGLEWLLFWKSPNRSLKSNSSQQQRLRPAGAADWVVGVSAETLKHRRISQIMATACCCPEPRQGLLAGLRTH